MKIKLILLVFFVSLFLTGCTTQQECPECICDEIEEPNLLDISVYDWYNVIYTDDIAIDFFVENYGDKEIKNLVVKCYILNELDNVILSHEENLGNFASKTSSFHTLVFDGEKKLWETVKYYPMCKPISCENCDMIYKQMPSYIKTYDKLV